MLSTVFGGSSIHELDAQVSAAGVGSFSTPVAVNDVKTNDQFNPVIVLTPDGGLFAAWQDMRSGVDLDDDVYTSKSVNNGSTFSPSRRADDSTTRSRQVEPAVAVSGNGTLFLTWQDNRRSMFDYDVYFAKSFDGGLTFTQNIRVNDLTPNLSWQERPSVAVTNTGAVYVAWTDDRLGYDHMRIRGASSSDWGATFTTSKELVPSGGSSGQDGVRLTTSGNRIFAAFTDKLSGASHPYVCFSTNGGKTFSNPVRLDSVGDLNISQRSVSIAPMPGGGVAVAWEDNRSGTWDIYMSIVSSKGVITTSNVHVDDDTTGSYQATPSIAADQLGNVYAAWQDERDGLFAVRFAYMIAGSSIFNSSIAVAAPGSNDIQGRPSLVVSRPGVVFAAWQDEKANAEADIYCASAYFPGLFGLSLRGGWNFISIPSDVAGLRASTLGLKADDMVCSWNSTTQIFQRTYIVGRSPPAYDFPLTPSTGYWVFTGSHEVIKLNGSVPTSKQTKHLVVPRSGGWAIVGFESLNTSRSASDIPKMLEVPGGITTVAGYDPATNSYTSYNTALPLSDFALAPGQAYWCWCTDNATLSYFP